MMHRKAWAAVLAGATVGLAGCTTGISSLDTESLLGLPTGQRPGSGDALPGKTPSGGGGSGGGTSSGGSGGSGGTSQPGSGGTFGESGSNPTQVSLASATSLRVDALFPSSTQADISISNTTRGMLAAAGVVNLSSTQVVQPALSVTWPSVNAYLAFGPRLSTSPDAAGIAAGDPRAAFKRELRLALRQEDLRASRSVQSLRSLITSPSPSVIIKTPVGMEDLPLHVYDVQTVTINGRATRFAIAVDSDDQTAVFGGSQGTALMSALNNSLRNQILPALQATYGPIPNQTEAQQKGIQFRDDVTYFIFSSKLEANLLGYFNPGDFFPGQNSNQIRALYLSADAAESARSDTTQRNDLLGTIAHELQHLCFAWNRVKAVDGDGYLAEAQGGADIWIDEGLAMLATARAGFGLEAEAGREASYVGPSYNLAGHVKQFLTQPGAFSMVAFHQGARLSGETGDGNAASAYGMAYLFAQYMVDQVGDAVIGDIVSSTKNGFTRSSGGISGTHDPLGIVNDALGQNAAKLSTLFANFSAAVALDGTTALTNAESSVKQRYDIRGINLRQSPFPLLPLNGPALGSGVSAPRPYGIRLMDPGTLNDPSTLKISGNSSTATRLILLR